MEPKYYAIPINDETRRLCEELQGGPVPYIALSKEPYFIIVLDDPELVYAKGVVPRVDLHPKFLVLNPESIQAREARAVQVSEAHALRASEARLMKTKGYSNARIAKELKITEGQVRHILKPEEKS